MLSKDIPEGGDTLRAPDDAHSQLPTLTTVSWVLNCVPSPLEDLY
ncbi:hypothetical protein BFJ70_g13463 [Fusarium oxysporum]|nr:hypothetical protein BFJ70_g13463 [Fusarium oxysporum]